MDINEETRAAVALSALALELRRNYYHNPYEHAPEDLIDAGIITNLEWDERDSLWVAFDVTITLEVPPSGTPIGVYAEEGPVVTMWRGVGEGGINWTADWDVDLSPVEKQKFLRRLGDSCSVTAEEVRKVTADRLESTAALDEDDRQETSDVAREWMSSD